MQEVYKNNSRKAISGRYKLNKLLARQEKKKLDMTLPCVFLVNKSDKISLSDSVWLINFSSDMYFQLYFIENYKIAFQVRKEFKTKQPEAPA